MPHVALYTFGLLDPGTGPTELADFSRRGIAIYAASAEAPGFLGQAEEGMRGTATHAPGEDFGVWGRYALPLGLPDFAGHDPHVHIATLSRWTDVPSARRFVYEGLHRQALALRRTWFLRGPWPGHVLWRVEDDAVPQWADGVGRLEALAAAGDSAEHFTFGSSWGRD